MYRFDHRHLSRALASALVWLCSGCEPAHVDLIVEQPTPTVGGDPNSPTAAPFAFTKVGAAFVGISGSYPYVLLYEDAFTCAQLTEDGGAALADVNYDNILILVGGWEEGEYPIFDVLGATGQWSVEGQAIAYLANRTGRTLNSINYARGGAFVVDAISEVWQTVRGDLRLEFEDGTLAGDFTINEYCDVY